MFIVKARRENKKESDYMNLSHPCTRMLMGQANQAQFLLAGFVLGF